MAEQLRSYGNQGASGNAPASNDQAWINKACREFTREYAAGQKPQIEAYLEQAPDEIRSWLLKELIAEEISLRRRAGQVVDDEEYVARFFDGQAARTLIPPETPASSTVNRGRPAEDSLPSEVKTAAPSGPTAMGRYRVQRPLGQGGFGTVYLGRDPVLDRDVALKVPRGDHFESNADLERFLAEARTVAQLNHPGIVAIYDILHEGGTVCIVQEYVDGQDLARWLAAQPKLPDANRAALLIAEIAEAIAYAHQQGIIHRDLKPANVLLDPAGHARVADFGLAARVNVANRAAQECCGTPAYMSPEQVRGESHRLDGRSDIWSLGVILYETLTGRRPFLGQTTEVYQAILHSEPKALRQIHPHVPSELQRICLKCLSKQMSDRYAKAADLAEDLRRWQEVSSVDEMITRLPTPPAEWQPAPAIAPRVIPKGLRSFDADDADFFLELLRGPRGRDGLPESIRFWKARLESVDPERAFPVGVLYGPSGCGKSSLVKAGILPRLASNVMSIYVDVTADDTEARVLRALRRRLPDLPAQIELPEALARVRAGEWLVRGAKVVLVLDQFEQWLHARVGSLRGPLIDALRHCDGKRVQCLVLLRDDFWMAATQFMRELDDRLVEGENSLAVDLFDLDHAQKVLAAFGRSFGKLPDETSAESPEQVRFLAEAIAGLAEEGKIVPVRLALFAEMMKGRAWLPSTLATVGGASGVGVAFLEDTFGAATAPPEHRLHQKAARSVLTALLPEAGQNIRGHTRSFGELSQVSGYAGHLQEFRDLMRILDGEVRLITPFDSTETPAGQDSARGLSAEHKQFQLTHDYLVPALREWLTRKQKETRRGRASLRLAERSALWTAKPENRQLPGWWEWLSIRLFTGQQEWSDSQRMMMQEAGRYFAIRGAILGLLLLTVATIGGYVQYRNIEQSDRRHAADLVQSLLLAETTEVPEILPKFEGFRRWTDGLLNEEFKNSETGPREQLNVALALLPTDSSKVDYLLGRLLDADPQDVPVIRDALAPYGSQLQGKLWSVAAGSSPGPANQRLTATSALAKYDPQSSRWVTIAPAVATDLVNVPAVHLAPWIALLRPVRLPLLSPLAAIFRDDQRRETERSLATDILADYAADQPKLLAELVMDSDASQLLRLYPKLSRAGESGVGRLVAELDKSFPPEEVGLAEREALGKRQAMSAAVLLKLGQPKRAWTLLKHQPDPRVRSYLIDGLGTLSADPQLVIEQLDRELDPSARRALILALGELKSATLRVKELRAKFLDLYRNDPDAGIHSAVEWLLRHWNEAEAFEDCQHLATGQVEGQRQWYINRQAQTFATVVGPVKFYMGSHETDKGRGGNDYQWHEHPIDWSFAIGTTEVTVEQYLKFRPQHEIDREHAPTDDCPVNKVNWYDAAAYCNWLSEQEGIPKEQWCFTRNAQGEFAAGMNIKADYLKLSGYRLPSEVEWEYACKAQAITSRYYGETDELLNKYACYVKNAPREKMLPVANLRPNDLGLFGTLGNVMEWTQDSVTPPVRGKADNVIDAKTRVVRGGAFSSYAPLLRAAYRVGDNPATPRVSTGFRVARTLPGKAVAPLPQHSPGD